MFIDLNLILASNLLSSLKAEEFLGILTLQNNKSNIIKLIINVRVFFYLWS